VAASSTPVTLAALARAQARMGDPAAVDTAGKAVAAGAQSAAAHEAQGEALLAMQRGDEAAAAFRKALAIEPKRASARAGLANALVLTGKASEAVTEAKKATEDDPRSGEAFAALASAIYAAAPDKQKGWGEAINEAQQGAFVSPRNAVVQVAVGRLFEAGGNAGQAEQSFRKEADPGYVPAQLALLQVESRKGDVSAAITRAKALAQSQPQNLDVQLTLGKLLARNGDWDEAAVALGKVAAAMPASAEVQALAGTAYQYIGQSDDALAAYKKAVQLAPGNNDYRSTYGLLLGLNKQYAEGITELQKVTGTAGYKDAAGWVNLGWLYRNVDPPKASESAQAYQKALQIDPKNAQAALGLGWAHLTGQQYDQAIEAFNKAMALDKGTAGEAYNGIGWSQFFKKDITAAKESAEKAKAAGRPTASLLQNIDRFEKGQAAAEDARRAFLQQQREGDNGGGGSDAGALCNQVQRGGGGAIGAARKLGTMGAAGAQCLVYAVSASQDIGLKQAAANALGNIGGAARSACPHLAAIARSNPYEQTMMDAKQQELWVRWEDLRRAARSAMAKIGC
jgi:tetratricopeptide (TPR) repeat protein